MPIRTASPRTSNTVMTMSLPMTMLSPTRRVRISKARSSGHHRQGLSGHTITLACRPEQWRAQGQTTVCENHLHRGAPLGSDDDGGQLVRGGVGQAVGDG